MSRLIDMLMPWPRALLLFALLTGLALALYFYRREPLRRQWEPWLVLFTGVAVARLVYVSSHWNYYSSEPASIGKLWQGGFEPLSGIAAMLVVGLLLICCDGALRERWHAVLVPVLAGTAVWVAAGTLYESTRAPGAVPELLVFDLERSPAPLTDVVASADGPVVINLWATWCLPCRAEMPLLSAAQEENPDVTFLFLNQGENIGLIEDYLADEALTLQGVFMDPLREASDLLEARAIPSTYFYDRNGQLVESFTGELNYPRLVYYLDKLD